MIALDEKLPSQDSLFNPPEGSVSREEKSFLSHRVLVSKGHFCSGGDIPSEKKITLRGNFHFANFDSMVNLSKIPII